jgi:uncharacterized protein (TIRG00374 family)
MRSHIGKIAVSLALTAILLYFFLRQIQFRALAEAISSASPGWLVLSTVLGISTFLLRALRWIWLLEPVAPVRFGPAFRATAVGFLANNLPGKIGEVLRPALLARSERLPFSPLLASIVLERVFDGAAVVFFFAVAAMEGLPGKPSASRLLIPTLLLSVLICGVLFATFRREATERALEVVWRLFPQKVRPRLSSFSQRFVDGFASLKSPRLLGLVTVGSLAMWLVVNLQIWAVLRAFHLELPLPAAFVVTTFAVIGLMFPTPGGIGSYHLAVRVALTEVYSVAPGPAVAVPLLAHAISFVPVSLIGLFLLFTRGGRAPLEALSGLKDQPNPSPTEYPPPSGGAESG